MPKKRWSLVSVRVNLKIPWLGTGVTGTWEADEEERKAAWELYVELVTRISVVELQPEEGLLREALSSLYSLFGTTRDILRRYGPGVATPRDRKNGLSFGYLAVLLLNRVLRPVLAKWHPLLLDHEARRPRECSAVEHEKAWAKAPELRNTLNEVRIVLIQYSDLLAEAAGVTPLPIERK